MPPHKFQAALYRPGFPLVHDARGFRHCIIPQSGIVRCWGLRGLWQSWHVIVFDVYHMILAAIHYLVFPDETQPLETDSEHSWHQIDGQLRLEFTDLPAHFVSWSTKPVPHALAISNRPFFAEELLGRLEMSDHPFWRKLIGHELQLDYATPDHRVLVLATPDGELFLSSQHEDSTVPFDSLRVSPVAPT